MDTIRRPPSSNDAHSAPVDTLAHHPPPPQTGYYHSPHLPYPLHNAPPGAAPGGQRHMLPPIHQYPASSFQAQAGAYPPTSAPESGPPPHHMDHGAHRGYLPTNGVTHNGHPPPAPPGPMPQHHEPHSGYPMTPIDPNHYAYPPPQHQQPMYAPGPHGQPTSIPYSVQRKKQMRAQQACEQCRQRKQKCDEGTPCSFCKESNLSCQYRDTPPAKTDKNMEKVIELLTETQEMARTSSQVLTDLSSKVNGFDSRLRRMEESRDSAVGGADNDIVYPEESTPPKRKKDLDDHRTAPHKLILLWPSLGPLFLATQDKQDDGYVMEAGCLLVW